jgi:serine/threonine protein kinase/tetratricopeptide (TPR) repeat protein
MNQFDAPGGSNATVSERRSSGEASAAVLEAVKAYLEALEEGQRPDREEFLQQHVDIAGSLARCLEGLEFIHSAAPGLSGAAARMGPGVVGSGEALGDYRLLREIGRGGMGVVYEAEQRSLGRTVAVKVLPFAATLDPRQLQRFHNEARAAASLHHEHIVPVYAVGCERGVHYYAMQLVDGRSLAALIAQRQLGVTDEDPAAGASAVGHQPEGDRHTTAYTPGNPAAPTVAAAAPTQRLLPDTAFARRVAEWGVDAAEALEHAHAVGIVHRDVKPANLLVDSQGKVWVADFGLASTMADSGLTMTGDVLGTLRYMSPEQAQARRGVVDHRTDIYSLGVTLYELLTLRYAFPGGDRQELLRQIAFEEPRAPRKVNRSIPADLETVVLKAMEKNPHDRYATAGELAEDLRRFLGDEPIRAKRPSYVQVARRWGRRHQTLVWSGLVLLITAALVSGVAAVFFADLARRNAELAEARRVALKREKEQTAIAEAVNDFLNRLLAQADVGVQSGGEEGRDPDVKVRTLLDRAAQIIDTEFRDQPLTEAAIRLTLGNTYRALGEYEEAQRHLQRSVELRTKLLGSDHPETLDSQQGLAEAYQAAGHLDKAIPLFERTLQTYKAKLGEDHPHTLICQNNLAVAYKEAGQLDQAIPLLEQTLQALEAKLGANHRNTLNTQNNLANAYWAAGHLDKALPMHERILQVFKVKLGADHPDTLNSQANVALAYQEAGHLDQAIPLLEQTLQARKATLGEDHPSTLASQAKLAAAYQEAGQLDQAIPLLEQTLQAQKTKLGEDHTHTLTTQRHLAATYQDAGQLDKAIPLLEQTLKAFQAKLGEDHPYTLTTQGSLASAYQAAGQLDKAIPLYEQTLQARKTKLGSEHTSTLISQGKLANAYRIAGRLKEALPLLDQTLEALKAKLGDDHPSTLTCQHYLAGAYQDGGQLEKAILLFEQTLKAQKAKLGNDHPSTLSTQCSLAAAYWRMKQLDRSVPLLEVTYRLRRKKSGEKHPHTIMTLANLGVNYKDAGRLPEGIDCLERAAQTIREYPPALQRRFAWVVQALADAYGQANQFDKQQKLLAERLASLRNDLPADHPDTLAVQHNLGVAYLKAGKVDQALPLLEQTLLARKTKLGEDHPNTLATQHHLAAAYRETGQLG